MMGHREPLRGGDERDALTKWRNILRKRAGRFTRIEKRVSRRVRRAVRASIHREVDE